MTKRFFVDGSLMLDARLRETAITVKMNHGKIVKLSVPRLDLSGKNLNLSWDLDSGHAGNILDSSGRF